MRSGRAIDPDERLTRLRRGAGAAGGADNRGSNSGEVGGVGNDTHNDEGGRSGNGEGAADHAALIHSGGLPLDVVEHEAAAAAVGADG